MEAHQILQLLNLTEWSLKLNLYKASLPLFWNLMESLVSSKIRPHFKLCLYYPTNNMEKHANLFDP